MKARRIHSSLHQHHTPQYLRRFDITRRPQFVSAATLLGPRPILSPEEALIEREETSHHAQMRTVLRILSNEKLSNKEIGRILDIPAEEVPGRKELFTHLAKDGDYIVH